ncbi:hypothetical protein BKI52_23655 [marine bacterium AO1-C]|nr:hypothetical protein BKI52_23655 [marine bacterium AO1-C]
MSNQAFIISLLALLLFIFSPLLMAFLSWAFSGFKNSLWSEGPGGHGTYLWFMLITLPVGGLAFLVVLVLKLLG